MRRMMVVHGGDAVSVFVFFTVLAVFVGMLFVLVAVVVFLQRFFFFSGADLVVAVFLWPCS